MDSAATPINPRGYQHAADVVSREEGSALVERKAVFDARTAALARGLLVGVSVSEEAS
jgi:hypothetical protein